MKKNELKVYNELIKLLSENYELTPLAYREDRNNIIDAAIERAESSYHQKFGISKEIPDTVRKEIRGIIVKRIIISC